MPFVPDDSVGRFVPDKPPAAASKTDDSGLSRIMSTILVGPKTAVGLGETALNAVTGAIAKPVSDVAGIAAMAKDVLTGSTDGDAGGFKRSVQEGMTYQPRTEYGKNIAQYNPIALAGRGVDALGSGMQGLIAPPGAGTVRQMLGAGVHEAIDQVPGFLGLKSAPALESAGGAMQSGARGLMTSAIKPNMPAHISGKAAKAVDTMLTSPYAAKGVSEGGARAMQLRIEDLKGKVSDIIGSMPEGSISRQAVLDSIGPVIEKYQKRINTSSSMAAIQKAYEELVNQPLISGDKIPLKLAQEIKQGTDTDLGDKAFGQGLRPAAERDALKAMNNAFRREIEKMVPAVSPLNKEASSLLNALSVSERRVFMDANKNPIGLGIFSQSGAKFAEWMADRSPLFKSLVARMLYSGGGAMKSAGAGVRDLDSMGRQRPGLSLAPQQGNIPTLPMPPRGARPPSDIPDWKTAPGASVGQISSGRPRDFYVPTDPKWSLSQRDVNPIVIKSGQPYPVRSGNLDIPSVDLNPPPIADGQGFVALTEKDQAALRDPATSFSRKQILQKKEAEAQERLAKARIGIWGSGAVGAP